jgi:hypothetical protein
MESMESMERRNPGNLHKINHFSGLRSAGDPLNTESGVEGYGAAGTAGCPGEILIYFFAWTL